MPALFCFRFAQPDSGELRVGEHAERNLASGRHAIAAGDVVTHDREIISEICVKCGQPAQSPTAQTPPAVVCNRSFTFTWPRPIKREDWPGIHALTRPRLEPATNRCR
jgi:hypothetical protein